MRPAQLTPENQRFRGREPHLFLRFNEAGAINAGKRVGAEVRVIRGPSASMRPAQLTPENFDSMDPAFRASGPASMRPAQLTPENPRLISLLIETDFGFNEAGAINAGKPDLAPKLSTSVRPLQ